MAPDGDAIFSSGFVTYPDVHPMRLRPEHIVQESFEPAIVAYDPVTGDRLWERAGVSPAQLEIPTLEGFQNGWIIDVETDPAGARVYVQQGPTNDRVGALDAGTGETLWSRSFDTLTELAVGNTGLVVPETRPILVAAAADKQVGQATTVLAGLTPATGDEIWTTVYPGPEEGGFDASGFAVAEQADMLVAVGTTGSIGDHRPAIVAFDMADGTLAWETVLPATDGELHEVLVDESAGRVYAGGEAVADADRDLLGLGLHLGDGALAWRTQAPAADALPRDLPLGIGLSPGGDQLYLANVIEGSSDERMGLVAIATEDGAVQWSTYPRIDHGGARLAWSVSVEPSSGCIDVVAGGGDLKVASFAPTGEHISSTVYRGKTTELVRTAESPIEDPPVRLGERLFVGANADDLQRADEMTTLVLETACSA